MQKRGKQGNCDRLLMTLNLSYFAASQKFFLDWMKANEDLIKKYLACIHFEGPIYVQPPSEAPPCYGCGDRKFWCDYCEFRDPCRALPHPGYENLP